MKEETQRRPDDESTRFQKLARALFGVKKQDVPKHEPKKRERPEASPKS
jgi:hypothetical protein